MGTDKRTHRVAMLLRLLTVFLFSTAWCWAAPQSFQHDVLPVIAKHCLACHGEEKMAGLDLRTLAGAMSVVVPGDPDRSRLWQMIRDGQMPMEGEPLSDAEKQLFRDWILK